MNNKGFFSIQYLFSLFILILIATFILAMSINLFNSEQNIEKHITSRMVLDSVSDSINQVSSNGEGYSKEITLPNKIAGNSYILKVSKNEIVFKGGGKIAKNSIMPVVLSNGNVKVDGIDLYGGNSYVIRKYEDSKVSIDLKVWWCYG